MSARRAPLFVQPHLDDAALSVGGTIALAAAAGEEPMIVTVFCAAPAGGATLNVLARELHRRWGGTADEVWARRRREDAAACAMLGARSLYLGHEDAIYRGDQYATVAALRGAPSGGDAALAAQLADELIAAWQASERARIYLPLAVGGHVDHRLCQAAGDALRRAGAEVWYYEDFPYVTVAGALEERLSETKLAPEVVDVTGTFDRRVAAIAAYASQLPTLFRADGPFPGPYEALVARYASTLAAGGGYAERFWIAS